MIHALNNNQAFFVVRGYMSYLIQEFDQICFQNGSSLPTDTEGGTYRSPGHPFALLPK
jgi:hypothetical protein